jgi:hypothetical protein
MVTRPEDVKRITESTSLVTFDADTGQFRATFDTDRDSTSLAVVDAVASIKDTDPLELTPLQSVIDTTALDDMTSTPGAGADGFDSIRFRYENCQVTVRSGGEIEAIPLSGS